MSTHLCTVTWWTANRGWASGSCCFPFWGWTTTELLLVLSETYWSSSEKNTYPCAHKQAHGDTKWTHLLFVWVSWRKSWMLQEKTRSYPEQPVSFHKHKHFVYFTGHKGKDGLGWLLEGDAESVNADRADPGTEWKNKVFGTKEETLPVSKEIHGQECKMDWYWISRLHQLVQNHHAEQHGTEHHCSITWDRTLGQLHLPENIMAAFSVKNIREALSQVKEGEQQNIITLNTTLGSHQLGTTIVTWHWPSEKHHPRGQNIARYWKFRDVPLWIRGQLVCASVTFFNFWISHAKFTET